MAENEKMHVALPLKYRPMTFADVVGQEHVVKTLRHAIESGRVANAYLFIGPRGIGKTTLSRIFAKALNCTSPNGVEPCGECENCRQIAEGRSLDVTELDGASHNKVEDVRPIIEAVQFKPAASKYRIFIVDECHMLSAAAWNALLKTLEEPPPHVKFVFATTEGDKMLATIVSRCQRFDLRRLQTHQIAARLRHVCECEKVDAEEDALLAIARGSEGGMRDALSSLDQLIAFKGEKLAEEDALSVFGLVSRKALEDLSRAILTGDAAAILRAVDEFDSSGKNMRRLASELLSHFRNLVVYSSLGGATSAIEATPEQVKSYAEQVKLCPTARLFRVADLMADMEDKLRHVLGVRTLIELSLLRASRVATVASIDEIMRAVRELQQSAPVLTAELRSAAPTPPPSASATSPPTNSGTPRSAFSPPRPASPRASTPPRPTSFKSPSSTPSASPPPIPPPSATRRNRSTPPPSPSTSRPTASAPPSPASSRRPSPPPSPTKRPTSTPRPASP